MGNGATLFPCTCKYNSISERYLFDRFIGRLIKGLSMNPKKKRNMYWEYVRADKQDDLRWILGCLAWLQKEGKLDEEEISNLVFSLSDPD